MRILPLIAATVLLLTGCESGPGRSAPDSPFDGNFEIETTRVDRSRREPAADGEEAPIARGASREAPPHPELVRAIEQGEAKSSGPVTNERYAAWVRNADVRVRLEGQKGRLLYLRNLLKLAATDEEEFMERLDFDKVHTGCPPDRYLRIFSLVKTRIRNEIEQTQREIAALQDLLNDSERIPGSTLLSSGDSIMPKTLSDFGLNPTEIAGLSQIGIHGPTEFVEHFYLPEQHEPLAEFLGRDLNDVKALIARVAGEIPTDELERLAEQARRPRSFGVLPPEEDFGRDKP